MKKIISVALLSILVLSACSCKADEWYGPDKVQHAAVGSVIGGFTTIVSKNANYGCAAATIVGAAKEVYDAQHRAKHTASFKDFAVTAIGGCITSGVTGLIITPRSVLFNIRF